MQIPPSLQLSLIQDWRASASATRPLTHDLKLRGTSKKIKKKKRKRNLCLRPKSVTKYSFFIGKVRRSILLSIVHYL